MRKTKNNKKMWVLIGYKDENVYGYGGYTGEVNRTEEKVALFTSEKLARDYIRKSKLKNPDKYNGKIFRKKSLLSYYDYADVEEYIPESFVVDPVI